MKTACMWTQCVSASGETGCFLTNDKTDRNAFSPIFSDLVGLFDWMRDHKWDLSPATDENGNFDPSRCVKIG